MSTQTKTVRLDKEVMNTLAENREGFETPNECLKRLLNQRGCIIKNGNEVDEQQIEESEK